MEVCFILWNPQCVARTIDYPGLWCSLPLVHSHKYKFCLGQEISSMLLNNATIPVCRKHSQAQMSNPTHSKYVHFEIEL